jgi:hypothetical protein
MNDGNWSWEHFCSRLRACKRDDRLRVIVLLDDAVEEEDISQLTADTLLREWDVLRFPEQMPKPLVKHIMKQHTERTSLLLSKAQHPDYDDDSEGAEVIVLTGAQEEPCANSSEPAPAE